jgi:hypothetical protein
MIPVAFIAGDGQIAGIALIPEALIDYARSKAEAADFTLDDSSYEDWGEGPIDGSPSCEVEIDEYVKKLRESDPSKN